jgi:hypothetical protein
MARIRARIRPATASPTSTTAAVGRKPRSSTSSGSDWWRTPGSCVPNTQRPGSRDTLSSARTRNIQHASTRLLLHDGRKPHSHELTAAPASARPSLAAEPSAPTAPGSRGERATAVTRPATAAVHPYKGVHALCALCALHCPSPPTCVRRAAARRKAARAASSAATAGREGARARAHMANGQLSRGCGAGRAWSASRSV